MSLLGDFMQTVSALCSCLRVFDVVDGVRLLSQILPSAMPQASAQTREVPLKAKLKRSYELMKL